MAAQPARVGVVATPENRRTADTRRNQSSLSYRGSGCWVLNTFQVELDPERTDLQV